MNGSNGKRRRRRAETPALSREQRKIVQWLKQVRFKRALFGVSERDVWKKMGEMNELFQQALVAERIRYDTLLEQQRLQSWQAMSPWEPAPPGQTVSPEPDEAEEADL